MWYKQMLLIPYTMTSTSHYIYRLVIYSFFCLFFPLICYFYLNIMKLALIEYLIHFPRYPLLNSMA